MIFHGFEPSALEDGSNGHSPLQDGECNHPVKVVWWNVVLAFVLFLTNCVMSMYMSLGISKMLIIAGIRSIIQLLAVGYILKPLFATSHWEFVALYGCFMLWITAVEGMSRPSYSYAGMLRHIAISILGAVVTILIYGMLLVIQWVTKVPWWEPQYFIPIGGMLLGNSLAGISLALTTVLEELATGQDRIEILLAVGATRFEATKGVIQRSLNTALVPQVTQMSIVGIVSIPGMMTGQILAGADPVQAALYQIAILFLITTATALGSVITVFLAITHIIDNDHRLRSERLRSRDRSQGIEVWAMVKAISVSLCFVLFCT